MEEKLVYIKPICKNNDGTFEYDFLFSNDTDIVWGLDWDKNAPFSCENLEPDKTTYSSVKRVKTNLPLKTAEENRCYSMENVIHGILALGWIDIENLEEYPENGRMVFHFKDSIEKVKDLLDSHGFNFEE